MLSISVCLCRHPEVQDHSKESIVFCSFCTTGVLIKEGHSVLLDSFIDAVNVLKHHVPSPAPFFFARLMRSN